MAGFFGFFDYTKPGPGVAKDAPPKARIVVFFEIYSRKFWNLVKINMMFNIFNIPAVIIAMFASLYIFSSSIIPGDPTDPSVVYSDLFLRFMLAAIVMCIPVITVGPAQAGYTYLLRNYAREEHAFIWGDFKEHAMKNFKESIIVSLIDFFVIVLMLFSIRFYILNNSLSSIMMTLATGLMILACLIFLMMHLYLYPMLVTFKLGIKQLYKNALIFAIIKFLPNLGIILLNALIIFLTFGQIAPFNPVVGIILYCFITVSTLGFINNFYVYPKLEKYIMDKLEEEDDGEEEESEEDAPVFSDEQKIRGDRE